MNYRRQMKMSVLKYNEDGVYLCPFCGFEYTHHGKVEVYGRCEDDKNSNHVTVERYNVKVDRSNEGNPSSRREGISIQFWCEGCHRIHYLKIAQHKGNTIIEVTDNGELSDDYMGP